MARTKKFKMSLLYNTAVWQESINRRQQMRVLLVESPYARTNGCFIPKEAVYLVPAIRAMGFNVEHNMWKFGQLSSVKQSLNSTYYAVGFKLLYVWNDERNIQLYTPPDRVQEFLRDHTLNKDISFLLKTKIHSLAEVEEMKNLDLEVDEQAGFPPDYLELAL